LEEHARDRATLVFFEVPHRLRPALVDLEAAFGAERRAAVCRELTKIHEEIRRGSLAELRRHFAAVEPRGEFTLVVSGAGEAGRWSEADVRAALRERRRLGDSPSQAAKHVAEGSGWRRGDVYRLSLEDRPTTPRRSGGNG
jgi:16S rRNA (cytidine1402-2'-O)-methyltransferase